MGSYWSKNQSVVASEGSAEITDVLRGYRGSYDESHVIPLEAVECAYVDSQFLKIIPVNHWDELKEGFFSVEKIALTLSIASLHLTDWVSDIAFIVFLLSTGNVNISALLITGVAVCVVARYAVFLQLVRTSAEIGEAAYLLPETTSHLCPQSVCLCHIQLAIHAVTTPHNRHLRESVEHSSCAHSGVK